MKPCSAKGREPSKRTNDQKYQSESIKRAHLLEPFAAALVEALEEVVLIHRSSVLY